MWSSSRNLEVAADSETSLQRALSEFNRQRLAPGDAKDSAQLEPEAMLLREYAMRRRELRFIEQARAAIAPFAAEAPSDADAFVSWFEALRYHGPGQNDPLFDWLAADATLEQMTWFLRQESAGEAGFEDLLCLTQLKLPVRAKLELARNYWDEMGQGRQSGMHGLMLERLTQSLGIASSDTSDIVWESLALGNLMTGLAMNRQYAYQSLGALGVIELTAPGRSELVNAGLKRLGITGQTRRYFALHATLDIKHSRAWNDEVLHPLLASDPSLARPLAEGALLRLCAGARCFDRYKVELGLCAYQARAS